MNLDPKTIAEDAVICDAHFPDYMFRVTVNKELKEWAVPKLSAEYEPVHRTSTESMADADETAEAAAGSDELLQIEYVLPTDSFMCDICDEAFFTRDERNRHIDGHFRSFECAQCGKSFTGERQFEHHRARARCGRLPADSDRQLFECFVCHKEGFFTARSLRIHYNRVHDDARPFYRHEARPSCRVCKKAFANVYILNAHVREIHEQAPVECETCGKRFNRPANLKWHRLVHRGELPCTCQFCGKAFRTLSGLNLHKRTHTGEKPYKCDICGEKAYAYNTDLKRHKRSAHGIVDKVFACDQCDRIFYERKLLRAHTSKAHNTSSI